MRHSRRAPYRQWRRGVRLEIAVFAARRPVIGVVASCPSWARAVDAIATSLGISVETVKTHVVNAKDKLGAGDRTQLAVMALLYGLIDPLG